MTLSAVETAAARAADQEARHAAQTVFDRPLVLEAGAGTGKTTTLVARVLAWTLGAGWRRAEEALAERPEAERGSERVAARVLQRVVAITFTEAAAAEMAQRVGGELGQLAGGGDLPPWLLPDELPGDDELRHRARALLATLDHLVVRTFHAWSHALLSAHPLEAGLHPDLTVDADGSRLDEIVRETVEAALPTAYGEPGIAAYLELAAAGFGPPKLVEALLQLALAGLPASALEADPLAPERCAEFLGTLRAAARRLRSAVEEPLAGASRSLRNASAIADGLVRLDGLLAGTVLPALETALAQVAESFPDNLQGHVKNWARGRFNKTETTLFDSAPGGGEAVADAAAEMLAALESATGLDPKVLAAARQALAPLLARVQREMRTRGIVTFNDLLIEAARLLESREDVRRSVRRGIDQLLVDEFQDTDPLQCEVVGWLALEGPPEQRPGLFLVGDPKQSIYGWRNADLAAYDSFVERAIAAEGERRSLAINFRSIPAILDEVARSIEPVMVERRGVQPPFQPLLPSPALAAAPVAAEGERGSVEHWVSWCGDDPDHPERSTLAETTTLEAAALAEDLAALHADGVEWREMALLFRSTGDLDTYLEALRNRRIPFAVARDKQYYRRREVIEAAALVRTVLDPGDHLALLTVLRSSMVGVPDAALIPLWRRQLPQLVTELTEPDPAALERLIGRVREAAVATPRDVPGIERVDGWSDALLAFLDALACARQAFGNESADAFVERMRTIFLAEPVEAARYLGPYRLANLDRFFNRLLATLEEGGGNATALLRMLRASIAEAVEAEEARPEEVLEDAVTVTTIHTAKGLDWDHVYLAQLHKRSGGEFGPDTEAAKAPDGDWEYRLFGAATLGWQAVEQRREEVEDAERVRTLYVAMTRAERRLVLLGLWPGATGDAGWEPQPIERAVNHLDLLGRRPVAPPAPLRELWSQAIEDTEARWRDTSGALWRFLATRGAPATAGPDAAASGDPLADDSGAPPLPSARQVAAAATELTARRAEAKRRMARPVSAAASAEAHEKLHELAEREGMSEGDDAEARRGAARSAGLVVHRALEEIDLEVAARSPDEALQEVRNRLPTFLPATPGGDGADRERALELSGKLLDRLAGSTLLRRLGEIAAHVEARELPVLLPAPEPGDEPEDDAAPESAAPVGFVSGFIDLLYRDPESGRWVVADYKTDAVSSPEEVASRAAAYGLQGAVYARAVREALDLPDAPRVELWFLAADQIVEPQALPSQSPAADVAARPEPTSDEGSQLSLFGDASQPDDPGGR